MCAYDPPVVMRAAESYVLASSLTRDSFVRSLPITTKRYDTIQETPSYATPHELQAIVDILGADFVESCELKKRQSDKATLPLFPEAAAA